MELQGRLSLNATYLACGLHLSEEWPRMAVMQHVATIINASPTLAAAYSISRAVKIPVMCASGLSAVTAPMAITAGASGVGVGSAVNKQNDVVAMIAEVRSIADSLGLAVSMGSELENRGLRL